jgi:hypothetical protein
MSADRIIAIMRVVTSFMPDAKIIGHENVRENMLGRRWILASFRWCAAVNL